VGGVDQVGVSIEVQGLECEINANERTDTTYETRGLEVTTL
jgi:hypothetical protein